MICKTCNAQRMAHDAFGEQAWRHLPQCRGRHPHLHRFDEGCLEPPRALLLGASNSWFSVYRSALTIPTDAHGTDEVHRKVDERWDDLLDIEDRVILDYVINRLRRGQGEQQRRWLLDYNPDEYGQPSSDAAKKRPQRRRTRKRTPICEGRSGRHSPPQRR